MRGALSGRLFPERFGEYDLIGGYRLSEPVGYWNALGVLAALGVLLAVSLVARFESLLVRLVAAASTVPLALTLYFTFSRGAWLALLAGLSLRSSSTHGVFSSAATSGRPPGRLSRSGSPRPRAR